MHPNNAFERPGSLFPLARGRRVGQLAPAARLKRLRPAAQRERYVSFPYGGRLWHDLA
jgi:hypothetical protein